MFLFVFSSCASKHEIEIRNAIKNGNIEAIKNHLESEQEGGDYSVSKQKLLKWAISERQVEIVKYLVESGIDLTYTDYEGKTFLCKAIEANPPSAEILKTLISNGADTNHPCVFFYILAKNNKKFGPYHGQILDEETNKPIAGMAIVSEISTSGWEYVSNSVTIHTSETTTNLNGEFSIPVRKFDKPMLTAWNDENLVFYKPGYKCFTIRGSEFYDKFQIIKQKNKAIKIYLSKLKMKERNTKRSCNFDTIELDQLYITSRYYDQKRIDKGLIPYHLLSFYRRLGIIKSGQKVIFEYPEYKTIRNEKNLFIDNAIAKRAKYDKIKLPKGYQLSDNPPMGWSASSWKDFLDYKKEPKKLGSYPIGKYYVKFLVPELQKQVSFMLHEENTSFEIVDRFNQIWIPYYENTSKTEIIKIEKILEKVTDKSHMLFIGEDKKNIFTALLAENDIPYFTRTKPNVVGYQIIWDNKYKHDIEKIKIEFFYQIAKVND